MIVHKCDRKDCECQYTQTRGESATTPPGWYLLIWGKYSHEQIHYEICPDCRKTLGIPEKVVDKDVGEKLLEIIEDLVTDAVEEQTG